MKSAHMHTRIPQEQKDAIEILVKNGLYATLSEFLRAAIKTQLTVDTDFKTHIEKMTKG